MPYPYERDQWDGFGVVQAKFKQRSAGVSSGTEWLERQIKAELNEWLRPDSKRERLPEYLLFTTNVPLSAVPDTGGIARVNRLITSYKERNTRWKLKSWSVWHAEEICRLLDCYDAVRRTYAHFITPGDVLSRLMDTVSDADRDTAELIRAHVGRELLADQYVRLGESGAQGDNQRIRLGPVAVDLRASLGPRDYPPSLERAPAIRAPTTAGMSYSSAGLARGKARWGNWSARPTGQPCWRRVAGACSPQRLARLWMRCETISR